MAAQPSSMALQSTSHDPAPIVSHQCNAGEGRLPQCIQMHHLHLYLIMHLLYVEPDLIPLPVSAVWGHSSAASTGSGHITEVLNGHRAPQTFKLCKMQDYQR